MHSESIYFEIHTYNKSVAYFSSAFPLNDCESNLNAFDSNRFVY